MRTVDFFEWKSIIKCEMLTLRHKTVTFKKGNRKNKFFSKQPRSAKSSLVCAKTKETSDKETGTASEMFPHNHSKLSRCCLDEEPTTPKTDTFSVCSQSQREFENCVFVQMSVSVKVCTDK